MVGERVVLAMHYIITWFMPNRVSVVAGGSGFLGTAIRRALATGGQIYGLDVSDPGDGSAWIACDVRDGDQVDAAFAGLDRCDVLVHAVGAQPEKFWQVPWDAEAWRIVLDSHVLGAANVTRAALQYMVRQRAGTIVYLGSVYGSVAPDFDLYGTEGVPPPSYCAAKAALVGLARWVAVRHGPDGVTANVVSPSGVEGSIKVGGGFRKRLAERTPTRRLVTAEEVAEAVRYCLEARHLNGHELILDGGWCAR